MAVLYIPAENTLNLCVDLIHTLGIHTVDFHHGGSGAHLQQVFQVNRSPFPILCCFHRLSVLFFVLLFLICRLSLFISFVLRLGGKAVHILLLVLLLLLFHVLHSFRRVLNEP